MVLALASLAWSASVQFSGQERVGLATAEDLIAHWTAVTDEASAHDAGLDAFAHGTRSAEEGASAQIAAT